MAYLAHYAPGLGNTLDLPRTLRRALLVATGEIIRRESPSQEG